MIISDHPKMDKAKYQHILVFGPPYSAIYQIGQFISKEHGIPILNENEFESKEQVFSHGFIQNSFVLCLFIPTLKMLESVCTFFHITKAIGLCLPKEEIRVKNLFIDSIKFKSMCDQYDLLMKENNLFDYLDNNKIVSIFVDQNETDIINEFVISENNDFYEDEPSEDNPCFSQEYLEEEFKYIFGQQNRE